MFGNKNQLSGRSTQVVRTKKTRSAAVISFQVVSRRDGCSKVHSQRIWHSLKISQTPGIGGGDENAKTVAFLKRSPSGAGSEEEERPAGDVNANRYTCSVNIPVQPDLLCVCVRTQNRVAYYICSVPLHDF